MLKIGYFAWIGRVSVKTLHYYEDIGLFRPAQVDPFTGYRYYTLDQLAELNRIIALKDLGLSLEQIGQLLAGDVSPAELRGMLRLRQAQLREQVADHTAELARVEARLKQLDVEDQMPEYDVALKVVEPMLVASRRVIIPQNDQVPAVLGSAFDEINAYLSRQGARLVGPCLARWHSSPEVYENEDVEAIYPIDRPLPETDRIKVYELPAEDVAAVVHRGAFAEFANSHAALLQWMAANGYRLNGAYREVYHRSQPADDSVTEVQFPVART
jgi:DNA-binding transcriptional MerR regulator